MSAPKKGTQTFQIRLEDSIIEELRDAAKKECALSANALAADWIRQRLKAKDESYRPVSTLKKPEFDFKELFFEERKANEELRKIIANLSEERKNFPIAEPAVVVKEGSGSTASSESPRQEILRLLRAMEPSARKTLIGDINVTEKFSSRSRSGSGSLLE